MSITEIQNNEDLIFKKHELFHYMDMIKKKMNDDYLRIQKRTKEDPGTAGDEGEENWADFFRDWLPANYHVVTKGRIIDQRGNASPQDDILILHPNYPRALHNSKYFFAGGVIAAFECKLTLKKRDLDKICQNSTKIKRMLPSKFGTPYDELNQPILFGVLAHSHSWKNIDSLYGVMDTLTDLSLKYSEHPGEMLDVVCIANSATFDLTKRICVGKKIDETGLQLLQESPFEYSIAAGYFVTTERLFKNYNSKGEIFCALLVRILNFMAFEDTSLRKFASYIQNSGAFGGIGKLSHWDQSVLSPKVLSRLKSKGYVDDEWSKWAQVYY